MLTRIEIDGFKSFTNFSMEFSPLTIIAGLNASGKSNLFDALHLLSLLAEHDLNTAFDKVQRGSNLELFTQYADGRFAEEMRFAVEVVVNPARKITAGGKLFESTKHFRYEINIARSSSGNGIEKLRLLHEDIGIGGLVNEAADRDQMMGGFDPEGRDYSILSALPLLIGNDLLDGNTYLLSLKDEFKGWRLIYLDTKKLPTATPAQSFGLPGTLNALADNLAGVFWRLSKTDPYLLTRIAMRLASLVPGIKEIIVKHEEYYHQYHAFVITTAGQRFPLHLLSEGTLRMLALCTLVFDPEQKGVLGLEEPENGVHPARLAGIAELLRDLSTNEPPEEGDEPAPLRQVIVNTHSPGLIKACLAAVAGQEGGTSGLTVWFSQLVSRSATEDGKRVMRRVTDMIPVLLPNVLTDLSEKTVAALDPSQKQFALYQLIRYLESADPDTLLDQLGLSTPQPSAA